MRCCYLFAVVFLFGSTTISMFNTNAADGLATLETMALSLILRDCNLLISYDTQKLQSMYNGYTQQVSALLTALKSTDGKTRIQNRLKTHRYAELSNAKIVLHIAQKHLEGSDTPAAKEYIQLMIKNIERAQNSWSIFSIFWR